MCSGSARLKSRVSSAALTAGRKAVFGMALTGVVVSGFGLESAPVHAQGFKVEQVATRSAGQEGWRLSEQDMDLYGRIFFSAGRWPLG